jgi:hypothetical protein
MKEVAKLLNDLCAAGIIVDYALFGATAQMRYTEPIATLDADVLVTVPAEDTLDVLRPIYDFCKKQGYAPEGEAIRVGAWPVQFIPVFDSLTKEAVAQADTADFEGTPLKVVKPDYLAVIALNTGRAKDFARILALIESGSTTLAAVKALAEKHQLHEAWQRFQKRFINE